MKLPCGAGILVLVNEVRTTPPKNKSTVHMARVQTKDAQKGMKRFEDTKTPESMCAKPRTGSTFTARSRPAGILNIVFRDYEIVNRDANSPP